MWDSNSPLQLLQTMPRKLTAENLEKLQLVIDADKYKNSLVSGFDLCGMYAPFCRGCKKTSIFPCALAYVNMMQAGGVDIEIDAKPMAAANPTATVPVENTPEEETAVSGYTYAEQHQPAPVPVMEHAEEPVGEVAATAVHEQAEVVSQPSNVQAAHNVLNVSEPAPKRKIRIAVARKKL